MKDIPIVRHCNYGFFHFNQEEGVKDKESFFFYAEQGGNSVSVHVNLKQLPTRVWSIEDSGFRCILVGKSAEVCRIEIFREEGQSFSLVMTYKGIPISIEFLDPDFTRFEWNAGEGEDEEDELFMEGTGQVKVTVLL